MSSDSAVFGWVDSNDFVFSKPVKESFHIFIYSVDENFLDSGWVVFFGEFGGLWLVLFVECGYEPEKH